MSLLAPAGLVALLLLPIIIAIHLWRVRYRRYELSSTLLWSRVLSETPLRRPRRLPTRLLLLRCSSPRWLRRLRAGASGAGRRRAAPPSRGRGRYLTGHERRR